MMELNTEEKTIHGCCPLDCPDTCSWTVQVKDGRASKLMGNRDHPFTRGALCVKVSKYIDYTLHPDRITKPLIRVGSKGEGKFREATWDECLNLIAERFQHDIDTHGGESIWPHMLTGNFGFINGIFGAGYRLFNYLGASKNAVTNCSVSGDMAIEYTVGADRPLEPMAIRHANLVIIWGTNTISTNQHLRPFLEEARKVRGAKIICIDPVRGKTADFADEHIPIVPGTDGALAFGLMNVIVKEGLQDQSFIDNYTTGWEHLRPKIEEFTAQKASEITGVADERIMSLAREIAAAKPGAIRPMKGIQRHAGGGMAVRALACIPSVTGDWQYSGGGLAYDTGGYFKANFEALWRNDLRMDKNVRTLQVTRLGESLLELDKAPVKSLFIWSGNPLVSAPNTGKIRKGLEREDLFTVVSDQFMTETAKYADVFLPSTMQLEHNDLHRSWGHLYVAWNAKAVDAPGECLPMAEIFRRLAKAMKLEEPSLYATDDELAEAALSSDHPSMDGITVENLKKHKFIRQNYSETASIASQGFTTPSGKVEFYSQAMADDGYDPVPGYLPTVEVSALNEKEFSSYPYALLSPGSHYFLNSVFANFDPSQRRQGEQSVTMHPEDAAAALLNNEDIVKVYNRRGSYVARLIISDVVARGVIMSPKGQWVGPDGSASNVNSTVDERDSDFGGGAVFNDNRVAVTILKNANVAE